MANNGLTVAGGLLPTVGIGLLLRYLPAKEYFSYLVIGFVMAVYMKIPLGACRGSYCINNL